MRRRRLLLAPVAALPWVVPAAVAADAPPQPFKPQPLSPPRLAAAWDTPEGAHLGVLAPQGDGGWRPAAALAVPTRAHGIVVEPEGSLLAVARRPGDWLVRWQPSTGAARWHWTEGGRSFNGHARRRGRWLYTTETEHEGGEGRVVVRDARSLAVLAAWPSGGVDPHDLRFAADGTLWVANGGIATRPETGRTKLDLDRMDSSLVQLDARTGRLLGQWRLADRRLSLRHLAWQGDRLAIALQAEHDDAAERAAAPVLALFDGGALRLADMAEPLAGYAGDVLAVPQGFVLSAPRAGAAVAFDRDGRWLRRLPLAQACPLAAQGVVVLAGGEGALLRWGRGGDRLQLSREPIAPGIRLDNHWQPLAGGASRPRGH